MNKEIPLQYKKKVDECVISIADSVNELLPIIKELGDNFEMSNDNFVVKIFIPDVIRGKE